MALGNAWLRNYPDNMFAFNRIRIVLTLTILCGLLWPEYASACPGCKEAVAAEGESGLGDEAASTEGWINPAYAYSYSVLFLLGMPVLILAGFATACYRACRKSQHPSSAAIPYGPPSAAAGGVDEMIEPQP
jgi:hypothetical protein